MSTAEVAAVLQCDVRTVHRWVALGRLTPTGYGPRGMYVFDADVILRLATVGAHSP